MARKDSLLRLHTRLVTRRDALRKALHGDLDSLREYRSTFDVGDSVDAAVDTANDEISSQLAELESRELEQIEYALERLLAGSYGRCELCDGKIAEARINALPYTTTCIDCQRESERTGRAFGRHGLRPHAPAPGRSLSMDDADVYSDRRINLADFEVDFSESSR